MCFLQGWEGSLNHQFWDPMILRVPKIHVLYWNQNKNRASATLSNTKIKEKAKAVTVKAEITALMDPSRFEWDSIHQSFGGRVGQRRQVRVGNYYGWWLKPCTSWYGTLSHYLQGFIHPRWCRISSINSSIDVENKTTGTNLNPKPSFLGVISYNPYFDGLQPSFFMVVGSKGRNSYEKHTAIEKMHCFCLPISFQKVQWYRSSTKWHLYYVQ